MQCVAFMTERFILCLNVPGLCKHHIVNRLLILRQIYPVNFTASVRQRHLPQWNKKSGKPCLYENY